MNKMLILKIVAIILIFIGITLFCFPNVSNYVYEQNVEEDKEDFIVKISEEENVDILQKLLPDSRRFILSLWNEGDCNTAV